MSSAKKPIIVALIVNKVIAIMKFIAAFISGSPAMLAESYHSLSDTFNQVFLLVGLRAAKKAPDEKHPFGYSKAAYFWSFVVAMLIFGVAGTLSLVHGIEKIQHPVTLAWDEARWGLGVLVFAFLFEGYALRVTVKELSHTKKALGVTSLRAAIKRSKDAALLTILYEDSLALVGIVLAATGQLITLQTGDGRYDAAASMLIGLMLMAFALMLANRNRDLLIGEAIDVEKGRRVLEAMAHHPNTIEIISCRTMHLGATDILVAAEIHFADGLTTDQIEETIDRIERDIKQAAPNVKHCVIEPEDPARTFKERPTGIGQPVD